MSGDGEQSGQFTNVSVTAAADCPFSIAPQHATEFLKKAENGDLGRFIRFPGHLRLPFRVHRDELTFGLHGDTLEPGRVHEEIRLYWPGGSWILPNFRGAIRFRIATARTRIHIDGLYDPPRGVVGRIADALIGRHIARASMQTFADRLADHLGNAHRSWLGALAKVRSRATVMNAQCSEVDIVFSKALVAVDGGELTVDLTDFAIQLGSRQTYFVCAVDPSSFLSDATAASFESGDTRGAALEYAQGVVDRCLASAERSGVSADGCVVELRPVDAILTTAASTGADLIVVASHGRRGIQRMLLGSVSEEVARRAKIPVLFIPSHPSGEG